MVTRRGQLELLHSLELESGHCGAGDTVGGPSATIALAIQSAQRVVCKCSAQLLVTQVLELYELLVVELGHQLVLVMVVRGRCCGGRQVVRVVVMGQVVRVVMGLVVVVVVTVAMMLALGAQVDRQIASSCHPDCLAPPMFLSAALGSSGSQSIGSSAWR